LASPENQIGAFLDLGIGFILLEGAFLGEGTRETLFALPAFGAVHHDCIGLHLQCDE